MAQVLIKRSMYNSKKIKKKITKYSLSIRFNETCTPTRASTHTHIYIIKNLEKLNLKIKYGPEYFVET